MRALPAAVAFLITAAAAASASASPRPSPLSSIGGTVSEASHRVDVRLRGFVAEVTTTQSVIAKGRTAEAVYRFKLPSNAAIVGLKVTLANGKSTTARPIDSQAVLVPTGAADGAKPDVALLRLIEIDGWESTYELRVFPVQADRAVSWAIRWLAPLEYVDSRMVLRVPPRGKHDNLVTEQVFLSGKPAAGFDRFESVIGSGRELGRRLPVRFPGSLRSGVTIELVPRPNKAGKPRMEMATVALPGKRSALAYSLVSPHQPLSERVVPKQVLVVVDTSTSMGSAGQKSAALIASDLLRDAPESAEVGLILFDRNSRALWKRLQPNSKDTQIAIAKAIRRAKLTNGSDLAGAVVAIHRLLKGTRGPARIIVISDAQTPLAQTPASTASLVDSALFGRARFAHVTVVPRGAPLPVRSEIAAGGLVHESRGRMVTLRHLEVARRADKLWSELWSPPPLRDIELSNEKLLLADQPNKLSSGSGVFAVGFFRGPPPRALSATGSMGEAEVTLKATRRGDLRKSIMPLLLAPAQALPSGFDDLAFRQLAEKANVVTRSTALWAPYPGDKFAKARLALAQKWGTTQFRRLAPANEGPLQSYRFVAARPEPTAPPIATRPRATGQLDRAIVQRLMRTYVVPKIHGCYRRALVPAKNLRGGLTVVVELVRGEVQTARIEGVLSGKSEWAAKVEACALDAAYSIRVPSVRQGSTSEAVSLVRYPLNFKIVDSRGRVIEGPRTEEDVDTGDPLDGLDVD